MQKEVILKIQQVQQRTNLSRTEIIQKINAGTFPKPIKLNKRTNIWLKSQIDDWLQNQNRQTPQIKLKNFAFQKIKIFVSRLIFLVQIGKFVYSYLKDEIEKC
jgi:prophage regulatory protein